MIKEIFSFDFKLYFKKNALAVEINDSSVTVVSLIQKNGAFYFDTFGNWPLPPGLVEKGKIKNYQAFSLFFKKALKKIRGRSPFDRPAIISIPEEVFFSRVTHIAQVPLKSSDPNKIIEKEIEDHFPLYPDEVYYDYSPIDNNLKEHNDIFLAASPKNIINQYLNILKEASLIPFIIEGESLAISRAILKFWGFEIQKPTLIIDIADYKITLIIYFGKAPRFTAILPMPFILRQSTESRKKKFISAFNKEAEENFLNEIEKYLAFYEAHPLHEHLKNKAVSKIILSGARTDLTTYLSPLLAKRVGVSVEISQVNGILHSSGVAQISTVAAGLALRAI